MKNYKNLSIEDLKETSKNWNGFTKYLLVYIDGSGGMCGGGSRLVHVVLHGENSGTETGTIEVRGIATMSYNIARGANGGTMQVLSYYKGYNEFNDTYGENAKPTYKAIIEGSCSGGEAALCSFLNAEQDWIIENN